MSLYFIKRDNRSDAFSIAIITPAIHPSLEAIERGFKETCEQTLRRPCSFKTFNAQGSKTLLHAQIDEAGKGDFDLVFTIASTSSHMCKEQFEKRDVKVPIVFTAVSRPDDIGLKAEKNVTGVQEPVYFERILSALPSLERDIRKIALVYDPTTSGLQKDRDEVAAILARKGIELRLVEVFQSNELIHKVPPFLSSADAVLVLKDNTVVSGLDLLVRLCEEKNIPLIACDLDSVGRGATYSYSMQEYAQGVEAAKMAFEILEEYKVPGDIPIRPVSEEYFSWKAKDKELLSRLLKL
ncbi:MAG: ABC transporter substrate-binding protein [Verrucomicrobia bacterium]|nr:ABC transporter substrate-binding protein [Verrucomicrobiota bacterium]